MSKGTTSLNLISLFLLYSRILPGVSFLLIFYFFIFTLDLNLASISILVLLSIIIGQIINSIGMALEKKIGYFTTHRELFYNKLDGFKEHHEDINTCPEQPDTSEKNKLKTIFYNEFKSEFGVNNGNIQKDEIYTLVRTFVESSKQGRSKQYQALHSFNRNMWVGIISAILFVIFVRYGIYMDMFRNEDIIREFNIYLDILSGIMLVLVSLFLVKIDSIYKSYYVEYLMADFCIISKI